MVISWDSIQAVAVLSGERGFPLNWKEEAEGEGKYIGGTEGNRKNIKGRGKRRCMRRRKKGRKEMNGEVWKRRGSKGVRKKKRSTGEKKARQSALRK